MSCAGSRDRCCAACRSRSSRARATGSSANPAAASRRRRTRPSATCRRNARITSGRIMVAGEDITKKSGDELRTVPDTPRLDGLPGPGRRAEPVDQGRAAGHRGFHRPRPERRPGHGQRARRAQARPDRRPGAGDGALSPPAVGRHAATRRHRDGPGLRTATPRARRTDDRPRRHRRGERPRPRPCPASPRRHRRFC